MNKLFPLIALIFCFLVIPCFCSNNTVLERAVTLYKWKYYDDAIVELNKIIQEGRDPFVSRANFLKAYCVYKKGYIADAKEMFRSLAIDPKFPLYDYAKFVLADICFTNKDYVNAYNEYNGFFQDSALKPEADIRKAQCLYYMGNTETAIELLKQMIAEGSDSSPLDKARFYLGMCYEKTGNPKEAIKAYHEVNLYHPLSPLVKEAMIRIGHLSRKYGIYPGAASAEDIFNKALIFYNFGDYASAGMFFNKIVTNYKSSNLWEDALFRSAMCDYNRKRLKSSILKFQRCVNYGSDYAPAAQFYVSFAYGKGGYFYQALDGLNKVIANYPDSSFADDAAYYIGYYYETNGYKDTALRSYENFTGQYQKSEFLDDAYWKIGRIYYFQKAYLSAYNTFKTALEKCTTGNMLDACAYWKALSQEKVGDKNGAEDSYRYVVKRFDHSFYGYRAKQKLSSLGKEIKDEDYISSPAPVVGDGESSYSTYFEEPFPFEPGIEATGNKDDIHAIKTANLNEHFRKFTELMSIGFYNEAAGEAQILVDNSPDDKKLSARLTLASANLAAGKVRDSIIYAEQLCNNAILYGSCRDLPKQTWQLAYPKGFYDHVKKYSAQYGIDESLVLAVIREESRFNPQTVSWANARGLMQIIPQTGRNVARLVGIRPYYTKRLHDPEINIKMGCYYLSQLIKRFEGNMVFALAAYNGGPLRVKRWMNKWSSEVGPVIDIDEFIESIPLSETKRYVQKVLKSYSEYKRLTKG